MNLHQKSPELLPPAAADCATGVRLIKIHEEEKTRITTRSARSTYPKKKSVLTSEATPQFICIPLVGRLNGNARCTFDVTINISALVLSAGIGVVFGYFPARRAARMDPVEALRHE